MAMKKLEDTCIAYGGIKRCTDCRCGLPTPDPFREAEATQQPYWDWMMEQNKIRDLNETQKEKLLATINNPDSYVTGRMSHHGENLVAVPRYKYDVYIAGSLRNPALIGIIKQMREAGLKVFCDWHAAGPEADDYWKTFYKELGFSYRDALKEPASVNTFNFDRSNMQASRAMVLVLPAGKSGHMELGWMLGKDKPGYILLDGNDDRWDVMYQFATGITDDTEELIEWLKKTKL